MSTTTTHRQPDPPAAPAAAEPTHYTRIARASATLQLMTPAGYPAAITVSAATLEEELAALLAIAEAAAAQAQAAGWTAPLAAEPEPSHSSAGQEPTFSGYVCSRTFDPASGYPAWIIVDGRQAHHREKQGDHWWSYKEEAGNYNRIFVIRKGEQAAGIVWPAGQEPKTTK